MPVRMRKCSKEQSMSRLSGILLMILALFGDKAAGAAEVHVTNESEFQAALTGASPGDEILLAPGVYPGRFVASGITDVVIRSLDPGSHAIIDAAGEGEGLKLSSVKRLTLTDLTVRNAALNAINIDDGSHVEISEDVRLSRLVINNSGDSGIKLTGVDNFHVDQVRVFNWAPTGVAINMIGSHNGLVERSYMENNSAGSGAGIQTKAGAANVIIRGNRLVNANERAIQIGGGSVLSIFRPLPPGDVEASGIIAEGNFIIANGNTGVGIRTAASFINVKDGTFRNNVVVRPSTYLIRILKENRNEGFVDTQNGVVKDNIIVWNAGDIGVNVVNTGSMTLPATFHFEGNQWYNSTNPIKSTPNLPSPEIDGVYGIDPQIEMRGITPWDFEWGKWLVNTSDLPDTFSPEEGRRYFLAVPGAAGALDLDAAYPLVGDWTLDLLTSPELTVDPFSYSVLIAATLGDYDLDQDVDANDYTEWKTSFGMTGDLAADGNGDGVVDAADYVVWRDQFDASGDASVAMTAPEPGGFFLIMFCLALPGCRRRFRAAQQTKNLLQYLELLDLRPPAHLRSPVPKSHLTVWPNALRCSLSNNRIPVAAHLCRTTRMPGCVNCHTPTGKT